MSDIPAGVDGEQLHLARRMHKVSVPQVARASGRGQWHLYKVEAGTRPLTWLLYVDLCRVFDVPVGKSLTYEGPARFAETTAQVTASG